MNGQITTKEISLIILTIAMIVIGIGIFISIRFPKTTKEILDEINDGR